MSEHIKSECRIRHLAVVALVTTCFGDINKNDKDEASALVVEQRIVTDAFPPFYWHGTTAFKEWMTDFAKDRTKNKYYELEIHDWEAAEPSSR